MITVTSSDLTHRWGALMAQVQREDAVLRVLNRRTQQVQCYISRDCPPDLAIVDNDGTREWLAPVGQRRRAKRCPACGDVKDVEEFSANRARHDGREAICKTCDVGRHKLRPARTPAEVA